MDVHWKTIIYCDRAQPHKSYMDLHKEATITKNGGYI